ncbi:sulfatase [Flavivirga sp. Y03]|uniref:Sulfatase n=2 Tax=Flavivirga algicola TaxID=2729136 RepID=A0ABX1RTM0_9FLAO|nr:sulfatase [Flavivirga algicola]
MNRTTRSIIFLCLFIWGCKHKEKEKETHVIPSQGKTNVVFILVDDLGWKDLGCYGSTFYETPNIDKLASKSAVFVNAYTPNPVCSPTRAAIMTGKYPSRVGITDWLPGHDPKDKPLLGPQDLNQLPLEEVTFAEVLKEAEYKTFFAGKWHLGDVGFFPEDQGFDINKGGHHMGHPSGGYYSPYNNPKLTDGPEGEYLTDRLTIEAMSFIDTNKDNPFLVYLAYYTVHTPIEANKKYLKKFEDKRKNLKDTLIIKQKEGPSKTIMNQYNAEYASMIYALDVNVGKLIKKLEDLDLMDNTLIVFTSDNGGLTTTEKNYNPPTSVRPLRAGKGWVYEGGIKVPLIIKKPGKTEMKKIESDVISMDLFPTILDVLELPQRPDLHIDGLNLNVIMGDEDFDIHDALFWDYPHYHSSGWTPGQAIKKGDWKLIYFFETNTCELYNVKEDISESNNLINQYPMKLEELKQKLETFNKRMKTKSPKENSVK